jgi:hypothetical protein
MVEQFTFIFVIDGRHEGSVVIAAADMDEAKQVWKRAVNPGTVKLLRIETPLF